MKFTKIIALTVIVTIMVNAFFISKCNANEKELQLYAKYACLMDANSGRVLYSKDGDVAVPIASTTKLLTCIIALENGNMEDIVTVSQNAAKMPDVQLNIVSGEQYKLKDLLYSLMLESHNDSAVAIAEHIAGSVEGFAKLMNEKALQIGCLNAHFITPNGLDFKDEGGSHSASAIDMAKIMRYCLTQSEKTEEFLEITRKRSHSFAEVNGKRHFSVSNKNAYLDMADGALSGKTGFTNAAGYCYVGALKNDGNTYIAVVLATGWPPHKTYKWSDTKKLMAYGVNNYNAFDFNEIQLDMKHFAPIPVKNAKSKELGKEIYANISILSDEERSLTMLKQGEKIEVRYELVDSLTAPVSKGTIVGCVKYCINEKVMDMDMIVIENDIEKIDYLWCLKQVKKAMFF
ncbi:MAG: D-alanyl-D-alanine carboxypeptidase [Lachnospira sp.]|nr:D-alanyl-D-alanine carboxypeptidase [Lachnospira sp.]